MKSEVEELNLRFGKEAPENVLQYFLKEYKGKIVLGSSLGPEDQVITHMMINIDKEARIFTLDTGRLFPETYELLDKTEKRYGKKIEVFFPDNHQVEEMVQKKGINLFYESVKNRKQCCNIRKVVPSKRALSGMDVWINGIRKDQTVSRFFNQMVEWDEHNALIKLNPLLNWTEKDVWQYVKENNIPYNALHDKGFPSIGCQPCTRAVKPDEDVRAGRWWWEQPEHKECGLHNQE
ncbi:MAG: phosphoadenylyl-sulfate reductase [Bacteroidales bacterium]|nr:phosphoadenylyl-sulfate reductase [Bacteroidales bacterium]